MKKVSIGNITIGYEEPTFIIAEIGGNFTTFEEAKLLIDAAIAVGANAVKLQTYKAKTITSKKAIFDMENTGVASQYELFEKYVFPRFLSLQ